MLTKKSFLTLTLILFGSTNFFIHPMETSERVKVDYCAVSAPLLTIPLCVDEYVKRYGKVNTLVKNGGDKHFSLHSKIIYADKHEFYIVFDYFADKHGKILKRDINRVQRNPQKFPLSTNQTMITKDEKSSLTVQENDNFVVVLDQKTKLKTILPKNHSSYPNSLESNIQLLKSNKTLESFTHETGIIYDKRVIERFIPGKNKDLLREGRDLYHLFPLAVDEYLLNYGTKTTWKVVDLQCSLYGKVTYKNDNPPKDMIFTICFGPNDTIYHRGAIGVGYEEKHKYATFSVENRVIPKSSFLRHYLTTEEIDNTKIIEIDDEINGVTIELYVPFRSYSKAHFDKKYLLPRNFHDHDYTQ